MKQLTATARLTRVRELERHCVSYVNAYVMELEARKLGAGQKQPGELCAREWGILCELMFGVLVQEGMVERLEEENDEEPES